MPLSICTAVSANCPEYGMIRPILTVSCASTATVAARNAATTAANTLMWLLPAWPAVAFARQSAFFFPLTKKYAGQRVYSPAVSEAICRSRADPGAHLLGSRHVKMRPWEDTMKRSTDRILTTHVGSLPGRGESPTEQDVPASVREIVAKQRAIGLD